jgi:hypothetical protein
MAQEPFAIDLLRLVAFAVLLPLALASFIVAWKLIRTYCLDRGEYSRNQARSVNMSTVLRGAVPTYFDGSRDERVSAGVAVDKKNNIWVEQGKLSEEAVSSVLR